MAPEAGQSSINWRAVGRTNCRTQQNNASICWIASTLSKLMIDRWRENGVIRINFEIRPEPFAVYLSELAITNPLGTTMKNKNVVLLLGAVLITACGQGESPEPAVELPVHYSVINLADISTADALDTRCGGSPQPTSSK